MLLRRERLEPLGQLGESLRRELLNLRDIRYICYIGYIRELLDLRDREAGGAQRDRGNRYVSTGH